MNGFDWVTFLASLSGAGLVAAGLSKWLGGVWADRIARTEQSRIDQELEKIKSQLSKQSAEDLDALVRKRAVYTRLANRMRVFLKTDSSADVKTKQAFLRVYDAACLWAAEPVAEALGSFLDLVQKSVSAPGSVAETDIKSAYEDCLLRMRQDSGFPDTAFRYRLVDF